MGQPRGGTSRTFLMQEGTGGVHVRGQADPGNPRFLQSKVARKAPQALTPPPEGTTAERESAARLMTMSMKKAGMTSGAPQWRPCAPFAPMRPICAPRPNLAPCAPFAPHAPQLHPAPQMRPNRRVMGCAPFEPQRDLLLLNPRAARRPMPRSTGGKS